LSIDLQAVYSEVKEKEAIMTASNKPICSQCSTQMVGEFCHHCGQQATSRKTGYRDVLAALLSGVFSIERGIFSALYMLIVDPANLVRRYWQGDRLYFYSPAQIVFYTLFIIGLHLTFIDKKILGLSVAVSGISSDAQTVFSPQLLLILLIVPLLSFSTYLCFISRRHSLADHLINAFYGFCGWAIIFTILGDVYALSMDTGLPGLSIVFLFCLLWTSVRVCAPQQSWWQKLLSLLLLVFVFVAVFLCLVGAIYLISPNSVSWRGP
jgi:hypothetical protein